MPKVTRHVARKPRGICKCGKRVEKGQEYFTWSFRFGGARFQHVTCGYPKPSQLTQSRVGEIYAAIEDYDPDASWADKAAATTAIREVAQEVCDAYREAAENFGGAGENAERADELETWISELEEIEAAFEAAAEADEKDPTECPL